MIIDNGYRKFQQRKMVLLHKTSGDIKMGDIEKTEALYEVSIKISFDISNITAEINTSLGPRG